MININLTSCNFFQLLEMLNGISCNDMTIDLLIDLPTLQENRMTKLSNDKHNTIGYFENGRINNSNHSTIGHLDGNRILSSSHNTVGYIDGNKITNSNHNTVAYIDDNRITNSNHNTIGYTDGGLASAAACAAILILL